MAATEHLVRNHLSRPISSLRCVLLEPEKSVVEGDLSRTHR